MFFFVYDWWLLWGPSPKIQPLLAVWSLFNMTCGKTCHCSFLLRHFWMQVKAFIPIEGSSSIWLLVFNNIINLPLCFHPSVADQFYYQKKCGWSIFHKKKKKTKRKCGWSMKSRWLKWYRGSQLGPRLCGISMSNHTFGTVNYYS